MSISELLKGIKITDIPNYDDTPKFVFATIAVAAVISIEGDQKRGLEIVSNTAKQMIGKVAKKAVNVAFSDEVH